MFIILFPTNYFIFMFRCPLMMKIMANRHPNKVNNLQFLSTKILKMRFLQLKEMLLWLNNTSKVST